MSYDIKTTLNLFEFLALFYIVTVVIDDHSFLKRALLAFLAGTLVLAVLTVMKSGGFAMPGYMRALRFDLGPFTIGTVALFDSIMSMSLLILGSVPIILYGVAGRGMWLKYPVLALVLFAAIITFSRSLWVALAVQLTLYVYFRYYLGIGRRGRILVLVAFVICVAATRGLFYDVYTSFLELRPSTAAQRVVGYSLALDMVSSNITYFLFGIGKGVFAHQFAMIFGDELVAHNFLLDILVGKGVLVLAAVVSLLVMMFVHLRRIWAHGGELAPLFMLSIAGMFAEGMFAPVTNSIVMWTFLALAYSYIKLEA
ncbi:MAG: hypothetical protein IH969_01855 [Candidatus Krumholzibacteriota bacterium]|nr:hypothetical protein [Candidatus Krumholzibacteriota bacterium]